MSFTGGDASSAGRTELSDAIIGRLFPQQPTKRWTQSGTLPPLGAYRSNRRDYSKPADPAGDIKVSAVSDHGILVEGHGQKTAWEKIGPNRYERVTGIAEGGPYDQLRFYGDAEGARLGFASLPHVAYHLVKPDRP